MHYEFFGALVDAFLALLTFVEAGAAGDFVALEEIANAPIVEARQSQTQCVKANSCNV
jgi:hypothetical protein